MIGHELAGGGGALLDRARPFGRAAHQLGEMLDADLGPHLVLPSGILALPDRHEPVIDQRGRPVGGEIEVSGIAGDDGGNPQPHGFRGSAAKPFRAVRRDEAIAEAHQRRQRRGIVFAIAQLDPRIAAHQLQQPVVLVFLVPRADRLQQQTDLLAAGGKGRAKGKDRRFRIFCGT